MADDDHDENTPGYVAPAKATLDELKNKDADDEALNRWKAKLLEGTTAGEYTCDARHTIHQKAFFNVF